MNNPTSEQTNPPAQERQDESPDMKEKIRELIEDLPYEERKLVKACKWQNGDKKWEKGFEEYVEKEVRRSGKFGVTMLKDYVKDLRRHYENTSESQDPETKKLAKGQLKIAEKILGIFTSETESGESSSKKKNQEKMKGLYSWENIKFTLRNIRRQIFELVGTKDPWWDYSQQHKGIEQLQMEALGMKFDTPKSKSAATPESSTKPESSVPQKTASSGRHVEAPHRAPANDHELQSPVPQHPGKPANMPPAPKRSPGPDIAPPEAKAA